MNLVKYKGTVGKNELSPQLVDDGSFTFQKSVTTVVYDYVITRNLIINLDKTPLSYIFPGKYTFKLKEVKNVLIKGADDNRQKHLRLPFVQQETFSLCNYSTLRKPKDVCQMLNFYVISTSHTPKTAGQIN